MTYLRYRSNDIIDDFGYQITVEWFPHKQGENDELVHRLPLSNSRWVGVKFASIYNHGKKRQNAAISQRQVYQILLIDMSLRYIIYAQEFVNIGKIT